MAKTLVSDVIIPTEFEKYAIERTAELSNFGRCGIIEICLLYTSPSPRDRTRSRMPSSA